MWTGGSLLHIINWVRQIPCCRSSMSMHDQPASQPNTTQRCPLNSRPVSVPLCVCGCGCVSVSVSVCQYRWVQVYEVVHSVKSEFPSVRFCTGKMVYELK